MLNEIHAGILAVSNVLYQPWFVPLLLVAGGLYFTFTIQFSRYVFEFPFQGPQNRTISNQLISITCSRNKSSSMFCSCLTP